MEFDRLVEEEQLLEWALVHGLHRYGTPRSRVETSLSKGLNVLLEIDVQGALQVRKSFPGSVLIFITPPSLQELESRMDKRGTESLDEKHRRLETAQIELAEAKSFDFQVINNRVEDCAKEVVDLSKSNK